MGLLSVHHQSKSISLCLVHTFPQCCSQLLIISSSFLYLFPAEGLPSFFNDLVDWFSWQVASVSSSLSTRQLLRVARRLAKYPLENLEHSIRKACLARYSVAECYITGMTIWHPSVISFDNSWNPSALPLMLLARTSLKLLLALVDVSDK